MRVPVKSNLLVLQSSFGLAGGLLCPRLAAARLRLFSLEANRLGLFGEFPGGNSPLLYHCFQTRRHQGSQICRRRIYWSRSAATRQPGIRARPRGCRSFWACPSLVLYHSGVRSSGPTGSSIGNFAGRARGWRSLFI